ncbi:MAG: hypothetical protein WBL63_19435 [Candidatus Acidiferrum sp.]
MVGEKHISRNSQLIDRACALREQGKLQEAYAEFCLAAGNANNVLEKAGILLNAATTLQADQAMEQWNVIRKLLSEVMKETLSPSEQDELLSVAMGIEMQEAQIFSAQGQAQEAVERLGQILEKYEAESRRPRLRESFDLERLKRAYLWAGLGLFEKALPVFEELESKQEHNGALFFYLGHCYAVFTKNFCRAQQKLERAISLGLSEECNFQAHCSLGMALYGLGDYANAKRELEMGAKAATPRYIKEAEILKWLEYTA